MRVLVTGAGGFLGPHVVRALEARGHQVCEASFGGRAYYDLRIDREVRRLIRVAQPDALVHLAKPHTDGISAMQAHPYAVSATAALIDLNVINAAGVYGVAKLVCLGSVCAYPEHVARPAVEADLLAGAPEPTNAAWGHAKRFQLSLLQAARAEHGLRGIHLVLANVYGPGDRSGHVIPSLIARIRQAQQQGGPVGVWGSPQASRSFLYVADAAEGIARALDAYDAPEPLNLCAAGETTMEGLVARLASALDFHGTYRFNPAQPVGQFARQFSTVNLTAALGWAPATALAEGLAATVAWQRQEYP